MTAGTAKLVYRFGDGEAEGDASMRDLLGGKGANLAEMCRLGLPVPPGFTITTEVCAWFNAHGGAYPEGLEVQVEEALAGIGEKAGAVFGDPQRPLLVSVRSGAPVSMPGMMDTVLNLGLNDETVEGLAARTGDERFAWDCYRRFIQMYGDVVLGLDHHLFEDLLEDYRESRGLESDTALTAGDWRRIVEAYKALIEEELETPFPQDVSTQLWEAIGAVFRSWNSPRAITYRRLHDIPDDWGTAVNVQAMVFGNMGEDSATGVAFTRNPSTGEKEIYGEFLPNAQGEDVVAGIRTPWPLTEAARRAAGLDVPSLEALMPQAFAQLVEIFGRLERHYRDMQDVEFTIQHGKLWILQTRSGKRTARAALRIAVDMASEGLISRKDAVLRIEPATLDQLLHPTIDESAERERLTRGLPASPGAAAGEIVFDSDTAEKRAALGHDVILVRMETSPEDIHGMHAARGILTARGGMTSHAAVVARGMGKPCVSGAGALSIDAEAGLMRIGDTELREGDWITIDGTTGEVFRGRVPMVEPELTGDFATLMQWADSFRRMGVRANADTPRDAGIARRFGAEGIGLCRTEHMFFDPGRIVVVREMILAETEEARRRALAHLLPVQRRDFVEIFRIMRGLPVTVRLLDPPLHEFLPRSEKDIAEVAEIMGLPPERIRRRVEELAEFNPMLGHRGVRLAITYPEIYEMQARAILEAAVEVGRETGAAPRVEIMVPLVLSARELEIVANRIEAVAERVMTETGERVDYLVGTMIELPRAALRAAEIAGHARFFSFGTNDLTQTTLGISRDDAARFMGDYLGQGIFAHDPFATIDRKGVGELVRMACERGRAARPELKLGVCGEHGGDPASIDFFEETGLDYVSCSPFRVPVARLAAAQAALRLRERDDD
jgi:pyruvate,orthophosphate dikinase